MREVDRLVSRSRERERERVKKFTGLNAANKTFLLWDKKQNFIHFIGYGKALSHDKETERNVTYQIKSIEKCQSTIVI